jgi:hypothetical protein
MRLIPSSGFEIAEPATDTEGELYIKLTPSSGCLASLD